MISYQQIVDHAERAARAAKRERKAPLFLSGLGDDAIRREGKRIPFLGDYVPRGFERVHVGETFGIHCGFGTRGHEALLVDSTGFGDRGELALTQEQFSEFIQRHPGYGYAITEAGQFQIVVAVYRRTLVKGKRKVAA